jgi:hypothetical protein
MGRLNKNRLDVSQVLLTYVALVGDVHKTAVALDMDPAVVRQLAESEGWDVKIQRVTMMAKSGRAGDFERAQNRALCFVQGHRIRNLIDRVILHFQDMTEEEVCAEITAVGKSGVRHVSARFFTDLAAAAEKCHAMTYAALGDTATDRSNREDEPDQMNASALHAAVMTALNSGANAGKPADVIVRELSEETQPVVVCQNDTTMCQNGTPAERTEVETPGPERSGECPSVQSEPGALVIVKGGPGPVGPSGS